MRDWIIGFIAIAVIVGWVTVLYLSSRSYNLDVKARAKTCHPYSVLTTYTLDGDEWVVCGNKEHFMHSKGE